MAEQKKKLSAKEVITDIRAGATDEFLMKKYGVSENGLQSLFQKLVAAKVITQDAINNRASAIEEVEAVIVEEDEAKPVPPPSTFDRAIYRCPACNIPQSHEFKICPQCGIIVEKFRKKKIDKTAAEKAIKKSTNEQPEQSEKGPKYPAWEDRGNLGWLQAIIQTISNCLFSTKSFFSKLPPHGGYWGPCSFGVILVSIGTVLSLLWLILFVPVLSHMIPAATSHLHAGAWLYAIDIFNSLHHSPGVNECMLPGPTEVILLLIICWLVSLGLLLYSLIIHAILLLVSMGSHKGIEATFRVICYSQSAQVCNLIPVLGYPAYLIWGSYLAIIGLREVHETSTLKAAVAVFLPLILSTICSLAAGL